MDADLWQMILGLLLGLGVLIILVVRTRVHAFPALIIAALIAGSVGGYGLEPTLASIRKGFGGTLGSIGIIIGFGVILGAIFEMSGAAKRMALFFIRVFGKGREEYALAATGFLVSIPIFCDSAFIILSSLAKAIARNTGKSLTTLGLALGVGLVVTHTVVPPTPGPLVVAANFDIELGRFIAWSLLISVPLIVTAMFYARYIGEKVFRLPSPDGEGFVSSPYSDVLGGESVHAEGERLPSAFLSFLPIVLPLVLIFLSTLLRALGFDSGSSPLVSALHNLGNPIIAVGIGLLTAVFTLTRGFSKAEVVKATDEAIKQAGIIVFVTGGGGALGMVLRDSGAGNAIAGALVQTRIPLVLLPIIIASLVRFLQGSGTVALITSSTIFAPIVASGDVAISPMLAALGCCVGGLFFPYFNDSYFWVVTRTLGIETTAEQIRTWSVTSNITWAAGVVILVVIGLFV